MKKLSTKFKALIISIVVIYVAIVGTYFSYYKNTIKIIESEHRAKIELIEESVSNEAKYSEVVSKIAERDIQNNMERISYEIMDIYEENPNVMEWDLQQMKSQFDNMDIYVIDESLTVILSTIKKEVGMSFDSYPQFSRTLRNRLAGNKFRSDSMNYSFLESELRKYSYMPTPDNKYLIELSVNIKDIYPELNSLNVLYISRSLKTKYPFIENIQVYKYDVDLEKTDTLFKDDDPSNTSIDFEQNRELMSKAVRTVEAQQESVEIDGNKYIVKYIPYYLMNADFRMNWWGTYLIKIVYNEHDLIYSMKKQKGVFFQSIIIISLLFFGFIYMLIYTIHQNHEMAYTDYLTKLPNRKKFEEYMVDKINEAYKSKTKTAVFFFDLNSFKEVNDTYGHNFGDKVLQEVANRIKTKIPKGGIICRLGGDEFIGAVPGFESQEEIKVFTKQISDSFKDKFKINSKDMPISSSIGVSIYPDHGDNIEELILKSDTAMYDSKHNKLEYAIYSGE